MRASRVHLYWIVLLACAGPLCSAPARGGHEVAGAATAAPTAEVIGVQPTYDLKRWVRDASRARSWRDRTPATYRNRVRFTTTQAPQRVPLPLQTTVDYSGARTSSEVNSTVEDKSRSHWRVTDKSPEREKSLLGVIRAVNDERPDDSSVMGRRFHNSGERNRIRPVEPLPSERPSRAPLPPPPPQPRLSYIQRRRPFGAAATAAWPGLEPTGSSATTAAPPRHTSLGGPVVKPEPPPVRIPTAPIPAAMSLPAPVLPPARTPATPGPGLTFTTSRLSSRPMPRPATEDGTKSYPWLKKKPPEQTVTAKPNSPGSDNRDRLTVINADGLVPGSVIHKTKLSVGLAVPGNSHHQEHQTENTASPSDTSTAASSIHMITTDRPYSESPYSTRRPEKAGSTTPSVEPPSVEVLNLYEVGVLPNASNFFDHAEGSGELSGGKSGQSGGKSDGQSVGQPRGPGASGGGSTRVTFPLHVLPALPGAAPPPDWPTVRPCCSSWPAQVKPVAAPDRPVYPNLGSSGGVRPVYPSLGSSGGTRPVYPSLGSSGGTRPVYPSLGSAGGTRPVYPNMGSFAGGRPIPTPAPEPSWPRPPPSTSTHPIRPTGRPCGTKHCVLVPPMPSPDPPATAPPAPPPSASTTPLGSVGSDLVCVYLRANGSALVLRADLTSGRYNISDDQNNLLGAPGWLGSDQLEQRDRPVVESKYDIVYIDNLTTTVNHMLERMRQHRRARWQESHHQPKTSIVCIVQRPEGKPGNETGEMPESPKPSDEPATPSTNTTTNTTFAASTTSEPATTAVTTTTTATPTTTPKPTIMGAVDSLSNTIASAVNTLGATAEAEFANTMVAADQTAVVIGSNVKNYLGESIPSIALATTVGIPVFVAMLALLGAPPLLLSALSVSSPLLLQGVAAFYNSLPN